MYIPTGGHLTPPVEPDPHIVGGCVNPIGTSGILIPVSDLQSECSWKPAKAGTLSAGTKIPAEQMDWLRSQPKAHVPRIEPGMQADEFRRTVEEWWAARKGPSARDVF